MSFDCGNSLNVFFNPITYFQTCFVAEWTILNNFATTSFLDLFVQLLSLSTTFSYLWPNDLLIERNGPCRSQNTADSTFDFIVVGAGAAGSVIAHRLSEDPSLRILLIEAGDDPMTLSKVPYFFLQNVNDPEHIYDYKAQLSSKFGSMHKNGAPYFIGKMLGGSTSSNAMIYNCGTDKDYNDWAAYVENPDLNFTNMLQYRAKMEKNLDITNNPTFHSTSGKVMVTNSTATDQVIDSITEGFEQLNFTYFGDFNTNRSYIGVIDIQFTIGGGERCSSARAYLQNVRSNLFVIKNSVVTKVTFDSQKKATGVIVTTKDSRCPTLQLLAMKEVILSAGALNTPKILLQSGIGKSNDLTPFGITQISDLPVGDNLHDHLYGFTYVTVDSNEPFAVDKFGKSAADYLFQRTGTLTNLATLRRQLYASFNGSSYPDIQMFAYRIPKNFPVDPLKLGYIDEMMNVFKKESTNKEILAMTAMLTYPRSTGTVKLQSSDFSKAPNITSGFFSDSEGSDVDQIIKAFQLVRKFTQTPAMSAINAKIVEFNFTNCQNEGSFWSREYLNCFRKIFSTTAYHPCGTAKMGKATDSTAVVDEKFRVKGVKKLRVVDASVFPSIPVANIQCLVYTLAEYAADVIKQTW